MNKIFRSIFVSLLLFVLVGTAGAARYEDLTVGKLTVEKSLAVQGLLQAAANTTGKVFYVSSTAPGINAIGRGLSSDKPFATVDFAINQTRANKGDFIIVMPGHAESYAAANGFDADVAGITIVGLGDGSARPTFTFTDTDGTIAIGAANVTIANVRFVAGISNIVTGISVEAAGDNFTLINSEVPESGTATFDFATFIDLASGADNITIDGMIFRQLATTPGDLDHFLKSGTGVNKGITIKNSDIRGEFLVAAIWSDQVDTNVLIDNSIIVNATNGQHAIEFTTTAAGLIRNTVVSTDAQATAIDPGSLDLVNVKWNSDTTPDVSGIDAIAPALGASGPDSIGGINATTTDSLHGKIGTDTEMADSSLYDLIPNSANTASWNATALAAIEGEATDALEADSLDKLIAADDRTAALPYPDSVVAESILAFLMSKSASPVATSYNNTTDSLEAIRDVIDTNNTADQVDLDAILADTIQIADGTLPAAPVAGSLARYVASGGTALGQPLPDSMSLIDVVGNFTGPFGGVAQDDNIKASLDLAHTDLDAILADTIQIADGTLPAAPVAGSLARYVASGGTALGQPLPDSMSLVDIIGNFTGPFGGAAQDDNIKSSLDLAHTDLDAILADTNEISGTSLPAAPVANSLAAFIASGGTALGTELADSKSIVDALGHNGTAFQTNGLGYWQQKTVTRVTTDFSAAAPFEKNLFTIAGGPIRVLGLIGIVTDAIGAANLTLAIEGVATAPGVEVTIASGLIVNADPAGTVYSLNAAFGGALVENANGVHADPKTWFIQPAGTIDLDCTVASGDAGDSITWYLTYEPLVTGVTVTTP